MDTALGEPSVKFSGHEQLALMGAPAPSAVFRSTVGHRWSFRPCLKAIGPATAFLQPFAPIPAIQGLPEMKQVAFASEVHCNY